MNYSQLDAFLKSQMQKREVSKSCHLLCIYHHGVCLMQGALSAIEAATITKFWQTQKFKVVDYNQWSTSLSLIILILTIMIDSDFIL